MMWDEAAGGSNFGTLCELVAIFGGLGAAEARAAGYVQGLACCRKRRWMAPRRRGLGRIQKMKDTTQ
jgi:hypothetical protein